MKKEVILTLLTLLIIPLISATTPISEIYGPTYYGVGIIAFSDHGKMYFPDWVGLDYLVFNNSGDIVYSETCDPDGKVIKSSGDKITSHGCWGMFDEDFNASYVDGNWFDPNMGSQIDNGNFGPMEMIRAIYFAGSCAQGFCEAVGGAAAGIGTMIAHPIDTTAAMLQPGFEVYYSSDRWGTVKGYGSAIKGAVVSAWNQNPGNVVGACGFEACAFLIPGGSSRWLYRTGGGKGFRGGGGYPITPWEASTKIDIPPKAPRLSSYMNFIKHPIKTKNMVKEITTLSEKVIPTKDIRFLLSEKLKIGEYVNIPGMFASRKPLGMKYYEVYMPLNEEINKGALLAELGHVHRYSYPEKYSIVRNIFEKRTKGLRVSEQMEEVIIRNFEEALSNKFVVDHGGKFGLSIEEINFRREFAQDYWNEFMKLTHRP